MACQRGKNIDRAFSGNDRTLINNWSCQEAEIVRFPYRFFPLTFICFNVQSFVWCEFNASFPHPVNSLSILCHILLYMSVCICWVFFFFLFSCFPDVVFRVWKVWDFLQGLVLKTKWSISERRVNFKVKVRKGISSLAITLKGGT